MNPTKLQYVLSISILCLFAVLTARADTDHQADAGQAKTDAFGDPLPPGAVARMGSERLRHSGMVMALAFTASGKLASGGDGTARLWDGATGKQLLRAKPEKGFVQSVAVSPDEKLLATGGDAAYLWEISTGKLLHRLPGAKVSCYGVAFSPDGKCLVSADGDDGFRLWDTATGKLIRHFLVEKDFCPQVTFSPDGKTLASVHGLTVKLWDVATGQQLRELRGHEKTVFSVTFSPDGKTLATTSYDGAIRLWDVAKSEVVRILKGHTRQVLSAVFSPDGKKLASAGGDNLVRVWEVATGKELLQIRQGLGEADGNVNTVAFSPDGGTLAAGSNHNRIRLWDAATGKEKQPPRGHEDRVTSLVFTPDGKRLISGCFSGTVIGWDASTGKELHTYSRDCFRTFALALSPDGQSLAAGCQNGTHIWKVANGEVIRKLPGTATKVGFLSRDRLLASGGFPLVSKVLDLTTEKPLGEAPEYVLTVAPDGHILHQKENSLLLRDFMTGRDKIEFQLPVPKPPKFDDLDEKFLFKVISVSSAVVSPDGKTLATASQAYLTNKAPGFGNISRPYAANIHLWEMATGKLVREIPLSFPWWDGHGRLTCLAFSPDGRTLAGGGRTIGNEPIPPAVVYFWDTHSGKEIHHMKIPRVSAEYFHVVNCLAFSPDGKTLATGGLDTTVLLWQLPTFKAR